MAAAPVPAALAATPYHATPLEKAAEQGLMAAIYDAAINTATGKALVFIPSDGSGGHYLMTLVAANTLPDGTIAVIVNGSPSDEAGNDRASHAAGSMLNVYLLSRRDEARTVLERHEHLATMGSHGQVGSVGWTAPGPRSHETALRVRLPLGKSDR